MYQEKSTNLKIIGAILILTDIVIGTFIFINLIVAVAANTLASLPSLNNCCSASVVSLLFHRYYRLQVIGFCRLRNSYDHQLVTFPTRLCFCLGLFFSSGIVAKGGQ